MISLDFNMDQSIHLFIYMEKVQIVFIHKRQSKAMVLKDVVVMRAPIQLTTQILLECVCVCGRGKNVSYTQKPCSWL